MAAFAAGVLGLAIALSGCQVTVAGAPKPTTQVMAGVPFAPYVDVTVPRPDLAAVADAIGAKHFVLAFALAGPAGCEPMWAGTLPIGDEKVRAEVDALRAKGGDVSVATGGANGPYLENACGTAADLLGAYTRLLDAIGTNRLDVDIEAPVRADVVVDALSQLQRRRGTAITLTLPIDVQGLTAAGLDLVHRAAAADVVVTVNAMDMNFPSGGSWGQAMVDAAQATLDQLRAAYPDSSEIDQNLTLGLTLLIGRNDNGKITTIADAQQVLDFAKSRKIGFVGLWSLARDNGSCPGRVKTRFDCSGVAQADFEFTRLLGGFAAG